LPRKIAFISPVPIKLPKEAEEEIGIRKNDVYIEYKHPVLYIVRATKRDKDYLYVYCGKTTYVIMKVRETTIEELISALKEVLQEYVREDILAEFEAEIRLYCFLSDTIDKIYHETLKRAAEDYRSYVSILLNFDPLLRRKLMKPLAIGLARIALGEATRKHYMDLPEDIKEKLSFKSFMKIVLSEISLKSLVRNILRLSVV